MLALSDFKLLGYVIDNIKYGQTESPTMPYTTPSAILTHEGVLKMLSTAVQKATDMGQPQCIVIVDASGEVSGEIRMAGAKFLARKSARSKAITAASIRAPSTNIPDQFHVKIAFASQGDITSLPGGLPIIVDGQCIGGIGVGSGSGDQDIEVANAALAAIDAQTF
jgi:glc operon protein GlcG